MTIYHGPVAGVTGILIGAAVFEHDHGDPKVVRGAINDALLKVAGEAGSAIGSAVGAGAAAGDAFAKSDITKWRARVLSVGIVDALGLADDKIGYKTIEVSPSRIETLVNQTTFNASLVRDVLPDGKTFNFPANYEQLIEGGDAKYQVYFRVRGDRVIRDEPETTAAPSLVASAR